MERQWREESTEGGNWAKGAGWAAAVFAPAGEADCGGATAFALRAGVGDLGWRGCWARAATASTREINNDELRENEGTVSSGNDRGGYPKAALGQKRSNTSSGIYLDRGLFGLAKGDRLSRRINK